MYSVGACVYVSDSEMQLRRSLESGFSAGRVEQIKCSSWDTAGLDIYSVEHTKRRKKKEERRKKNRGREVGGRRGLRQEPQVGQM